MTRIAIMQPAYLPWLGYFDLMDQVDGFVLLDNVQFSKQSWQHRNRIRTRDGLAWLTVPVRTTGEPKPTIDAVEIGASRQFPAFHLRLLELSYRDAPHASTIVPDVCDALAATGGTGLLTQLTVPLIGMLADRLGLDVETTSSGALGVTGIRSHLLVEICRRLDADEYLSPIGAVDYIKEDRKIFEDAGVRVLFQQFEHPEYPQVFDPFLPFASVVDLIANVGPDALAVIRSGRRPAITLDALVEP